MQVIVVGGGIAGFTLALSLHQAGIAVRVYEAVGDPEAVEVGIDLQPTAVREPSRQGARQHSRQTSELVDRCKSLRPARAVWG